MEHIILKELEGGYVSLVPKKGYILLNLPTAKTFSEAVVKDGQEKFFVVVKK